MPPARPSAFWLGVLLCLAPAPGIAGSGAIVVKLHHDGPWAVSDCAQARHERGEPMVSATRDRSNSLDRLHAELGVRSVRALFRRSAGRSFAGQRRALRERALARRSALPEPARNRLPEPPDLAHVYRLELAVGTDAASAAERYAADPHVAWAQPDFVMDLDAVADDPFLSSSGSWGQPFDDLWGIHRVGAPDAWETSRGEGVVVAVVDTGVDLSHPDLAANAWVNPGEDLDGDGVATPGDRNGIDDDANGYIDDLVGFDFANSVDANEDGDYLDAEDVSDADPFDDVGHGTHIAGIVAAVAGNGIGVAGVAPGARIMALKGFAAEEPTTIETLARAMVYAVLHGARVINNSWSCDERCPSNPLAEEVSEFATSLGTVVVTSAGNKRDDVLFYSPENRRSTISVGASDPDDEPVFFSNGGLLLDVMAPGGARPDLPRILLSQRAILSTLSSGAGREATGDGAFVIGDDYHRWSGTSMSAPHVAGVVALLLAQRPDLGAEEVRALIRAGARDLGTPGFDAEFGAGRLDAVRSLELQPPAVRARFAAPAIGAILVPRGEAIPIEGSIEGEIVAAELSVAAGTRPDPGDFTTLARLGAGERAGELARWDVEELEDGPYVLRLAVEGADGSQLSEFRPVSLERNPPRRLSPLGRAARRPAISGGWLAWEEVGEGSDPEDVTPETDLFVGRWFGGEPWRAAGGPVSQHTALLSGSRLAWRAGEGPQAAIETCRLRGRSRRCPARLVSGEPASRPTFDLAGNRLVWFEFVDGSLRLGGCRVSGSGCDPLPLPMGEGSQHSPFFGRGRLSWLGDRNTLQSCAGFPRVPCDPVAVETLRSAAGFGGGGDLLTQVSLGSNPTLFVCRIEADGACAAVPVGIIGSDLHSAVSGHRVVWSGPGPGGDADIFFCEFDAHSGRCPTQRLTGSAADQTRPDVSGARIVWEDDREGTPAIFGLQLPWLAPLADRSVRAGNRLRIPVRGWDPSGEALALGATLVDGSPIEALGMRFVDRGAGAGWLLWRPRSGDQGRHVVIVEGRGAGGLVTRRSFEIEVGRASRRSPGPRSNRRRNDAN